MCGNCSLSCIGNFIMTRSVPKEKKIVNSDGNGIAFRRRRVQNIVPLYAGWAELDGDHMCYCKNRKCFAHFPFELNGEINWQSSKFPNFSVNLNSSEAGAQNTTQCKVHNSMHNFLTGLRRDITTTAKDTSVPQTPTDRPGGANRVPPTHWILLFYLATTAAVVGGVCKPHADSVYGIWCTKGNL